MTPRGVERLAVRLAASGIAAGRDRGPHIAALCGYQNAIGLDMGGTSTDISLVYDGELRVTKEWFVEYGYPICFPSIEVLTIGAGGGSLAWIDEAGSLRNGPQSAGADPGPRLLRTRGRGADEHRRQPRARPARRRADRRRDDARPDAAERGDPRADRRAARPLDRRGREAIIQVANANMADAVRSSRSGAATTRASSPRRLRRCRPAARRGARQELSIPTVLVPPNPGITSALGCLLVDVRHDLATMFLGRAADVDRRRRRAGVRAARGGGARAARARGRAEEQMSLQRFIDMRYLGQWRSLAVPVAAPLDLDAAVDGFHAEHEREYNYRRDDAPVEIYRLTLRAVGVTPKPELARHERKRRGMPGPVDRAVLFDESDARRDARLLARRPSGGRGSRPAVIDQLDSTMLVPPGCQGRGRRVAEHPHARSRRRDRARAPRSGPTRSTPSRSRC